MGNWITVLLRFFLDATWMGNNQLNPVAAAIEPFNITEPLLHQLQTAMRVSYEVQWQSKDTNTTDIQVFRDITDKSIVAYRDGTCYAAWMGAVVMQWADLTQSWPRFHSRRVCGEAGCCRMQPGMVQAYESEYLGEMKLAIERCVRRCEGENGCPLVLTGHSQGASVAPVAAVALSKYNPILFTFGQHRVHRYSCDVLDNMDTYLRVVSICEHKGRPAYDMNAYFGTLIGRHTGTLIIVGEGGAATLGHNSDMWLLPLTEKCHNIHNPYTWGIGNLTAGPLDGYVTGSLCSRHIECKSHECNQQRCT